LGTGIDTDRRRRRRVRRKKQKEGGLLWVRRGVMVLFVGGERELLPCRHGIHLPLLPPPPNPNPYPHLANPFLSFSICSFLNCSS